MARPIIGITVDNRDNSATSGKYELSIPYSRVLADLGAMPLLLPHEPALASAYARHCHGLVLTGGVDPATEAFGEPTHPSARPMDSRRQTFELAMLAAAGQSPELCVLGVCLGMQLMALTAGGRLNQYLPQTHANAEVHYGYRRHPILFQVRDSVLSGDPAPTGSEADAAEPQPAEPNGPTVVSHHQQAVADPGRLRLVATAPDGVIEAIDDPARRFYAGVQWHPERGGTDPLNVGVYHRLVRAAAGATSE